MWITRRVKKLKYFQPEVAIPPRQGRYPGLFAFNEQQQELFKGREREKTELFNLIMSEPIVVLFAKSGVGKSSLLNAGLFPLLRENGHYPLRIRFQSPQGIDEVTSTEVAPAGRLSWFLRLFKNKQPKNEEKRKPRKKKATPLSILRSDLIKQHKSTDYSIRFDFKAILSKSVSERRLWEYLKITRINQNSGDAKPLVPVLVFDQFEEFFNYAAADRQAFIEQLSEVLHNMGPQRITKWLREINLPKRSAEMVNWAKQPQVKCVIAIRDDKLAELDQLKAYIPLILKNRYKLHPLLKENAAVAMESPANLKGEYLARPFDFDPLVLSGILSRLAGEQQAPPGMAEETGNQPSAGIDGSQLQKVCMFIEKKVIQAQSKIPPEEKLVVNERIINPDTDIQMILDTFYEEQLKTIGSETEITLSRIIIENHLVSGGARASITTKQMTNLLDENMGFFSRTNKQAFLNKLIEARLIKEEYTHLGQTFELSHDTLVNSVSKYADENRLKRLNKQKLIYASLLSISVLLLAGCVFLFYKMNIASNKTNVKLANTFYQQGNDYYAFSLWENYLGRVLAGAGDKKQIAAQLDSLTFFDIGAGDNIVFLSDSVIAVHEKDNFINIWRIDYNQPLDRRLHVQRLEGAYNLESGGSHRYLGYRTSGGQLMIYNAANSKFYSIDSAGLQLPRKMDWMKPDAENADSKMGFIPGGDFIGYLAKGGMVKIFDLDKNRQIKLRILKILDIDFDSYYISNELQISADQHYLAIHKRDTLKISNITTSVPRRVRVIKGVIQLLNTLESKRLCYLKTDTLVVENYDPDQQPVVAGSYIPLSGEIQIAPDRQHILYYTRANELVVYNSATDQIDTTIRDAQYGTGRPVNMVNHTVAKWGLENNVLYFDKDFRRGVYNLKNASVVEKIVSPGMNISRNAGVWSLVDDRLMLQRNGKKVCVDSLLQGIVRKANDIHAVLSRNGKLLAYIVKNGSSAYFLKIVDLNTGKRVLSRPNIAGIGSVFNDKFIMVFDDQDHTGIFFIDNQVRNSAYYHALYPPLADSLKSMMGINIF